MDSSSEFIVEFQNIKKGFGQQQVLKGLSLRIPKGKISFIIGQSGEGKSVALKHIVGILEPDAGNIIFDGSVLENSTKREWIDIRKKIGFLFQDGALFDSHSVFENVVFALREHMNLSEKELRIEALNLLERVDLVSKIDSMPSELSIGEKKRVGLARALSLKPALLMYDEPTTSMDSLVSEMIDNLILNTQKQYPGMTSLVVSHDIRSILSVAEKIFLLVKGVLYFEGSPADFKESEDLLVKQFLAGSADGPLTS